MTWEEGQPLGVGPTNVEAITEHLGWIIPRQRRHGVGLGGDPTDAVVNAWCKGHIDVPVPAIFKEPEDPWSVYPEGQVTMTSNKGNTFAIISKRELIKRNRTGQSPEYSEQVGGLS